VSQTKPSYLLVSSAKIVILVYLLTRNKFLFNAAVLILFVINRTVQNVLFGPLTPQESEKLTAKLSYTLLEFGLAFILIGEPVTLRCLGTLGLLLSVKWFHLLSEVRVGYLTNRHYDDRNLRLSVALCVLHLSDLQWIRHYFNVIVVQRDVTMTNIIFALETTILYNSALATTGHYLLSRTALFDKNRAFWFWTHSYLTLASNLVRLTLYFYFSCILLTHYCVPLHVFRETYLSLRYSIAKMRHAIRFRRSKSKGLEPLEPSDPASSLTSDLCIICRDPLSCYSNYHQIIRISKCGHTLHENCLLDWLEVSSSCPTCRRHL
jgi:E3 ubiquitin-protein ligase synoviolin